MADVESAETWTKRMESEAQKHDCWSDDDVRSWFIRALSNRDAAIREAARQEALEEAAEWCRFRAEQLTRLAQAFRIDNPASRVADQSDGEAAGLVFAKEHFRALATGKGAG